MLQEQWNKWLPMPLIKGMYRVENMQGDLWNLEVLLISLEPPYKQLRIFFKFALIAYQYTLLPYRRKSLKAITKQLGIDGNSWTFFKVSNSDYTKWLSQQSCEINSTEDFTHYVFITPDIMLDVACWGPPQDPLVIQE